MLFNFAGGLLLAATEMTSFGLRRSTFKKRWEVISHGVAGLRVVSVGLGGSYVE